MIIRTSYAKLADPSQRGELAAAALAALTGAGHTWLHVGTPADEAAEVWDLVVLAGCADADLVAEHHTRLMKVLGDHAVVTKAWSFVLTD